MPSRYSLGACRLRAIDLGVARKYAALLNNGKRVPDHDPASYFANLIDEVDRANVSPDYWRHVRHRTEQFQRRWRTLTAAARLTTHANQRKRNNVACLSRTS